MATEPGLRFVIDSHTVCTGADGEVKWEADTDPVIVAHADMAPELKRMTDELMDRMADDLGEAHRGDDEYGS